MDVPHLDVKYVANKLAPFFKENGYIRKGNQFYKFEKCCIINILFEHAYSIMPGFYVFPLYFPFEVKAIYFGSRLSDYRRMGFKDYTNIDLPTAIKWGYPTDGDKWIESVKDFYEHHVFPHLSEIGTLHQIEEFLNQPRAIVGEYWVGTTIRPYYKLRAYTHLALGKYDKAKEDIEIWLNTARSIGLPENAMVWWMSEMETLKEKMNLSKSEREAWMNEVACNTLQVCLGKNWESTIKNRLTLPIRLKKL